MSLKLYDLSDLNLSLRLYNLPDLNMKLYDLSDLY